MKLLRATLTASLLLVAIASAVIAGPLEDATIAVKRGDYAKALRLFRPMAEQGSALAQSALGDLYENGEGVPQNYAEAAKWYRLAGEQGDAFAQTRLAFMCQNGQGVPRDDAEAAKWFRRAADQGRVVAQNVLGSMYFAGRGVPKDLVAASMWFIVAAAQGDHDAARLQDLAAKLMTPDQIAQAQTLAREWKPKPER